MENKNKNGNVGLLSLAQGVFNYFKNNFSFEKLIKYVNMTSRFELVKDDRIVRISEDKVNKMLENSKENLRRIIAAVSIVSLCLGGAVEKMIVDLKADSAVNSAVNELAEQWGCDNFSVDFGYRNIASGTTGLAYDRLAKMMDRLVYNGLDSDIAIYLVYDYLKYNYIPLNGGSFDYNMNSFMEHFNGTEYDTFSDYLNGKKEEEWVECMQNMIKYSVDLQQIEAYLNDVSNSHTLS